MYGNMLVIGFGSKNGKKRPRNIFFWLKNLQEEKCSQGRTKFQSVQSGTLLQSYNMQNSSFTVEEILEVRNKNSEWELVYNGKIITKMKTQANGVIKVAENKQVMGRGGRVWTFTFLFYETHCCLGSDPDVTLSQKFKDI